MKDGIISAVAIMGLIAGLLIGYALPHPAAEPEVVTVYKETVSVAGIVGEPAKVSEFACKPEPEYPAADYVWQYLQGVGFSDAVCAGIMGNIMAEVGGGTLALRPGAYGEGHSYYGICQWNRWDFPEVQGQDLDYQLNYLAGNIRAQMGSTYEEFLQMDDPREAALCFAKNYERCYHGTYGVRQDNAERAYKFFTEGR